MAVGIPGTVNVTPTKIEMTPMRVTWAGVDVGSTTGSVVISPKYDKGQIKVDQFGKTIMDERINGFECTVVTELAEVRDPATWAVAFPSATYTVSGGFGTNSETFQLSMGASAYAAAQPLVLHPVVLADANTTQDHNFFLAYPEESSPITYGPDKQSGLKVTWRCFPTLSGAGAPKWYKFGPVNVGP